MTKAGIATLPVDLRPAMNFTGTSPSMAATPSSAHPSATSTAYAGDRIA